MDYNKTKQTSPMLFLNDTELQIIETTYPEGMSAAQIVEIFKERGLKFSEATFRKYVQLGLLPRSRRIGTKGKHKGSKGIYPVGAVRQVNEIKNLLSLDYTIEDIKEKFAFIGSEIEELKRLMEEIFQRLEASLNEEKNGVVATESMKRQMEEVRQSASNLVTIIEKTAQQMQQQTRIARDAV